MNDEASPTSLSTPAKRTGLRRRSVRVLLGLLVVIVIARVALPEVLRRVAVSQADKALVGRIEIDDIDLALITGTVTLKGLRVYADELPATETEQAQGVPSSPTAPAPPADRSADNTRTPQASDEHAPAASSETPSPAGPASTAATPVADNEAPAASKAPRAKHGETQNPTPSSTAPKPRSAEAEQAGSDVDATAPALPAAVFSAGRLSVDIGLRPLLDKIVALRAIELEHFDARIDRLQNGTLVLPAPAPADPEPMPEEPAPESEGPGWGVLLERVSVSDADLSFRDFTIAPDAKPLKAAIPKLEATNMALLIADTGLQPGTVSLDADVLGGHLTVEMTQRTVAAGTAFESHVVLTDLPLSDTRVYVPRLKWTSLDGRLDVDFKHSFEPEGPHNLSGRIALRDLAIRVANLDAPPLAWKKLAVDIGDVDVVKHNAKIAAVALEGGRVIVRAAGPEPLPVLRGLVGEEEASAGPRSSSGSAPGNASAETASAAGTPPASPAQPSAQAAPTPWTWQLEKVSLRDTTVDLVGGEKPLSLGVNSEVTHLSSAPKTRSNLTLNVKPPEGTLAVTGAFTIEPIGFDGRLKLERVSLPPLSVPVATPVTRLLRQGALSTDLEIAAGAAEAAPSNGVKVAGAISLDEFVITGEDDKSFAVRWKQIGLDIASILAPGVLDKEKPAAARAPVSIALSSFTFERPEFVVTRTEKGIVLPEALSRSGASDTPTAGTDTKADETTDAEATHVAVEAETQVTDSAEASPPFDVRVGRLVVKKMRIAVTDKAVKPLYRSSLDPIDFSATDVRWPGPYASAVTLTARGLDGAKLSVTGDVAPTASKINAELDGMPLAPLHPYAAVAGYGLGGGTASFHSKIKLKGQDYDSENELVLNKLQVNATQGDSLFAQQFGMPLSLALGLMTDLQGNITLNLPVSGGRKGASLGIGTAIRDALRQAILSTATSPLKLIGAVAEIGQKPASLTPQPVSFAPGRTREADGEAAKVEQLGKFLSATAALRLRLHGETSDEDRRWLAEQKLRAKIEAESGFMGAVRHIGEGDDREAALAYLQARAEDKLAELPEHHTGWFDTELGKQQVPDSELRALAQQRAEAIRDRLLENHKIAAERIVLDPIAPEDLAARPAVTVTLETATPAQSAAASSR